LLGVFILIHLVWSFRKFWKTNKPIVLFSFLLLLAVGFQGWLGKKVVDANLAVVKVTIHMLVALLIAAIPLLIIYRLRTKEMVTSTFLKYTATGLIVLLLLQIVLGTQVREQIDEISKPLLYQQRELWIGRLDNIFIIHRSLSWLVLAGCLLLCWKARAIIGLRSNALLILSSVIGAIVVGVVMLYGAIPAWAQPVHLLLASTLMLSVFAFRLKLK